MTKGWCVAAVALVLWGRALEGQGLPIRAAIGARATVLAAPASWGARLDTVVVPLRLGDGRRRAEVRADSAAALRGAARRVVVRSYPGT